MAKHKKYPSAPVRADQGIRVDSRLIGYLSSAVVLTLALCMFLARSVQSAAVLGIIAVIGFIATPLMLRRSAPDKSGRKKLKP